MVIVWGIIITTIYIITNILKYRYDTRNQQLKELSTVVDNLECALQGKPLPQESWRALYEKECTKYEEVERLYQDKCGEVAYLKQEIVRLAHTVIQLNQNKQQ